MFLCNLVEVIFFVNVFEINGKVIVIYFFCFGSEFFCVIIIIEDVWLLMVRLC